MRHQHICWGLLAMLASLVPGAGWAQEAYPSDVSITSLGVHGVDSLSVGQDNGAPQSDIRFQLGQRLRWTLGSGDGVDAVKTRLLADVRFTFDPKPGIDNDGQRFETNHVRQLGVQLTHRSFTLDLGRHAVFRGGPRLVDGAQLLLRPGEKVDVGVWAGLAPSLYETDFQVRPGFGPVIAFTGSRTQLSLVGEVAYFEGQLDRAALLASGRTSSNRLVEVSGRLDLELASPDGGPRLADFQVYSILAPSQALRIDAMYNAFSSYQYVASYDADPEQQRFAQRILALGQLLNIDQTRQDPTLNHLVGASARLQPETDGAAPRFELLGRYRYNEDPNNRYFRLSPTAGVVDVGDRLDLLANVNLLQVDGATQTDGGVMVVLDASDTVAIDASVRALSVPGDYGGLGWYADLYLDVVQPATDLLVLAGVSYISEPDLEQRDGGYGMFVRLAKYLRPPRKATPTIVAPSTGEGPL